MTRRGRRLTAAVGALALLLFAGRWTAFLLAERWWAAEISPAAVEFLTRWHLLRAGLEITAILIAAAWFVGHLLTVYRAVGSVQVRRNVANLEFREALTPGALLGVAIAAGVLLGLLVGRGAARAARDVALGWQGLAYGVTEPLQQRDVGLYVAQLPLWRSGHDFALLLVLLALGIVFGLYLLVGAVRWMDGRPAINSHARAHLGWLLVILALTLMWGYVLEPYDAVAGLGGAPDRALWRATSVVAPILAGVALATAVLSALWAMSARHALAAAGWIVLPIASLVGHWMVPPAIGGEGEPIADARTLDQLNRMAYGLESLVDHPIPPGSTPAPPPVPSLWNAAMVQRTLAEDSVEVVSVDPALLTIRGHRAPVWLATRRLPGGRLSVSAMADDRAGPAGEPLFYRAPDSLPVVGAVTLLDAGDGVFAPGAPDYRLTRVDGQGTPVGGWPRRLLLAWALQAPELLGPVPSDERVDWSLAPRTRLERLAPFASWGEPVARVVDGELMWLADGFLPVAAFPLSQRLVWGTRPVSGVRAALLGAVAAQGGATHVYLRRGADALAEAWGEIARGVVEPASAVPAAVWRAAPYPAALLRVQARALERPELRLGSLSGRSGPDSEAPRPQEGWAADTTGPVLTVAFERPGERRLSAVLAAQHEDGGEALRLTRIDSAAALPPRGVLESRWGRFPSYDALNDSVREDGATLERGMVRFDLSGGGLVAYQPSYATRPKQRPALAWVSVAAGDRQGAGRTLAGAWSNLLGAPVPSLAGQGQTTRLDEARRLLLRADSALRAADWEAFGRAWAGLRRVLDAGTDSTAP